MNNQSALIVVVVVILLGLGLWVVTSGGKPVENTGDVINIDASSETTDSTAATSTGVGVSGSVNVGAQVGEVKTFIITAANFVFTPTTMTVNKGDKVRITLKNTQGTHDFKLDEFGVNSGILQAGAEKTIEFVADKAGSFEYYCSIGNHRAMGMKGTLIVR